MVGYLSITNYWMLGSMLGYGLLVLVCLLRYGFNENVLVDKCKIVPQYKLGWYSLSKWI